MNIWDLVGIIAAVVLIIALLFICESLIYEKVQELKQRQMKKDMGEALGRSLTQLVQDLEDEDFRKDILNKVEEDENGVKAVKIKLKKDKKDE